MLKTAEYIRKGHRILDASFKVLFEGKDQHGHPSINAAKRESRKLQAGQLGSGILRLG